MYGQHPQLELRKEVGCDDIDENDNRNYCHCQEGALVWFFIVIRVTEFD